MNSYKTSQVKVKSGGFISTLQRVKEQINFAYFVRNFEKDEIRQITEFCKIIADVLTLPPECDIVIDGEQRTAADVQEVYMSLEAEHIETALENFNKVKYRITSTKGYIRTVLFNSYLELDNSAANEDNVRIAEND